MFASIDVETSGLKAGYHEIIQIGIAPLSRGLKIDGRPFYTNIKPFYPERADARSFQTNGLSPEDLSIHAPDSDRVMDSLVEWCSEFGNRRIPIAHNWEFERSFLLAWLGDDLFHDLFRIDARDTMRIAAFINDRASYQGETPPFDNLKLSHLCRKTGVENAHAHDALADAMATAEVYGRLLQMEWA